MLDLAAEIIQGYEGNLSWQKDVFDVLYRYTYVLDALVKYKFFSAFWLRSKCSICSYQLNIWYVLYWRTSILNWFLDLGEVSGACSAFAMGWPGSAVPPGTAHFCRGVIKQTKIRRTLPLKDVLADSAWPSKSLELFGNFYYRHFFLPCCC